MAEFSKMFTGSWLSSFAQGALSAPRAWDGEGIPRPGQARGASIPETTVKTRTSASSCPYCYFEAHQPNILETKGTHTASQKRSLRSGKAHQRGHVGIFLHYLSG